MKSLLVRFINVAVIAVAIVGYNGILTNREKTDEIAKLDAQLESEKLARKNAEEQFALDDFNDKVIKRKHIELADTMLISINKKAIDNIYNEGSQLYHSVNDLVLYATGAAACSTSDLLMVLDNINNSLDLIEKHLNQAYFQTWRYVQLRMGYWKEKVYRTRTKEEILEDAFSRWKVAGKLDY